MIKEHKGEKRFTDLNSAMQQYFLVTGRQLEPLPPKPVLSDFYISSEDHHNHELTLEIVKGGFWDKLPLFYHFCGAPTRIMKISNFPIYSFTNDLLPSNLYNLDFMKSPNWVRHWIFHNPHNLL